MSSKLGIKATESARGKSSSLSSPSTTPRKAGIRTEVSGGPNSPRQGLRTKAGDEKAVSNKRPPHPTAATAIAKSKVNSAMSKSLVMSGSNSKPKPEMSLVPKVASTGDKAKSTASMSRSVHGSLSQGSSLPKRNVASSKEDPAKNGKSKNEDSTKPNSSAMSKSLHGSLSQGTSATKRNVSSPREEPAKNGKSKSPENSENGAAALNSPRNARAGHCNVENGRQMAAEVATTKKSVKPVAKPRLTAAAPKIAKRPQPVRNDAEEETEEEDPGEVIHAAILKQTRQTGSLNLSGRGLSVIPAQVWGLNEPDENDSKQGLLMDKVDEERWWDRVDLTKLILASNQISKVSPRIKSLVTLQILDLHDNNLGSLPEEIGELVNLTKLNASHNKLSFLPSGLFNLSNLRFLNLAHNEINEIHQDMGTLHLLETIDLAHNKLIELPSSLACLSKVTNFNASHNILESIPHEISFLRALNCLELSHNNISELPESVEDLHNLERLYLQHNKLKVMPTLRNCQHLKEIYLGFNCIQEVTDVDLENMPNIKLLDLRDNQIPSLPDEIINLQGLERLDVSSNNLTTLPFTLGTLPHLKSLQVDGNPMKAIRRDIIARGTTGLLKYLKSRIDEEELNRLRDKGQVSPVPSICGSPPIPDKFVMKSAQVMKLTGKDLNCLPKEAVDNAIEAEVTGVDLSKNQFSKFPATLEPLMSSLFELNLSSNRLEDIPSSLIGLGANLQYLNVANNKIAMLPPEIGLLVNLREICLNCNRLSEIPACLYGCAKLETIMISDNRIQAIDVDGLKKLTKLSVLDVGNNNIGTVPPELGLLTNLRSLTLDGNAFRVPRPQILVKGTESVLAYLRDRIPRSSEGDS